MKNVLPRKEVPRLRVETTSGMQWDIRDQKPENFTMVIFYRGLHCPVCKSYLEELNKSNFVKDPSSPYYNTTLKSIQFDTICIRLDESHYVHICARSDFH